MIRVILSKSFWNRYLNWDIKFSIKSLMGSYTSHNTENEWSSSVLERTLSMMNHLLLNSILQKDDF